MKYFILKFIFITYLVFVSLYATAQQLGGNSTYEILNLSYSSRSQYLGGGASGAGNDIRFIHDNPAALSEKNQNNLLLSNAFYFHTNYTNVTYAHNFFKTINTAASLQFMTYGEINSYDENKQFLGKIYPHEAVLGIHASKKLGKLQVGVSNKWIYSNLSSGYTSYGVAMDAGFTWVDTSKKLTAGLVIKNVGTQFKTYGRVNTSDKVVPDVQIGITKRFKHLPFTFGVTAHHIYAWDILTPRLKETTQVLSGSTSTTSTSKFKEQSNIFFSHLIFSGEFNFGKNFKLGLGYNHQRRAELAFEKRKGLAGFSFGFGIQTKRFDFGYALAKYSTVGASHQLTLLIPFHKK